MTPAFSMFLTALIVRYEKIQVKEEGTHVLLFVFSSLQLRKQIVVQSDSG